MKYFVKGKFVVSENGKEVYPVLHYRTKSADGVCHGKHVYFTKGGVLNILFHVV